MPNRNFIFMLHDIDSTHRYSYLGTHHIQWQNDFIINKHNLHNPKVYQSCHSIIEYYCRAIKSDYNEEIVFF